MVQIWGSITIDPDSTVASNISSCVLTPETTAQASPVLLQVSVLMSPQARKPDLPLMISNGAASSMRSVVWANQLKFCFILYAHFPSVRKQQSHRHSDSQSPQNLLGGHQQQMHPKRTVLVIVGVWLVEISCHPVLISHNGIA